MKDIVDHSERSAAILSPGVDLLCVGGLSLLVLVPLLASGVPSLDFLNLKWLIWGAAVVNYAHFMASYRIVYRDREMIRKHLWATVWVPLIMLVLLAAAVATADQSQVILIGFFAVASAYLAWHYTGQAWGMVASYTALTGARFEPRERRLIRSSLRILLAWHVLWFLRITLRDRSLVEPLYVGVGFGSVVALALGARGFMLFAKRTGHRPPARALVPWIAIFFWYAALARWGLPALLLVQLFHALQYLEFPARVEVNRAMARDAARATARVALWLAALVMASVIVLLIVPGPAMSVVARLVGAPATTTVPVLILYFINIHHYFTDGVIWKISNPDVRRDLFAHVAPPVPAKAPVSAPRTAMAPAPPSRRPKPARR